MTTEPVTTILEIHGEHEAYAGERELRYQELRRPLGMPRGSEEYRHEAACRHVVALAGADQVIGCVLFHPDGEGGGRLLQMAVARAHQGRGQGRRLVRALEAILAADGVHAITLHARDHAVGFYERLGYAVFDAAFEEVGIVHRRMRRSLTPEAAGSARRLPFGE